MVTCATCRGDRVVFDSPEDTGRLCDACVPPCPRHDPGEVYRPHVTSHAPYGYLVTCDCFDGPEDRFGCASGLTVAEAAADWAERVSDYLQDAVYDEKGAA